ncbi:MAG: type IV pilus assembly protein PilB [Myxococcota bacterium]|jgi:type IV pilus assembly protein PilB
MRNLTVAMAACWATPSARPFKIGLAESSAVTNTPNMPTSTCSERNTAEELRDGPTHIAALLAQNAVCSLRVLEGRCIHVFTVEPPVIDPSEFLSKHILFSGLNERQLDAVLTRGESRVVAANSTLLTPSSKATFFVVLSGKLEVTRDDGGSESLETSDYFGARQILLDLPASATVTTVEDSQIVAFGRTTFLGMLTSLPGVGTAVSRELASQVGRTPARRTPARRTPDEEETEDVPFVRLSDLEIDPRSVELLSRTQIEQFQSLPISLTDGVLTVAMVNPLNVVAVHRLKDTLRGADVRRVAVALTDFESSCKRLFLAAERGSPDGVLTTLPPLRKTEFHIKFVEDASERGDEDVDRVDGGQVVALVNQILGEALEYDASDIHIAPEIDHLGIRYRIDGQMMSRSKPVPLQYFAPLIARLKVLSRMDITERRKPQDGRIAIRRGTREVDFRSSTVPTRFGEKMVLRVLDRSGILVGLKSLIRMDDVARTVIDMVEKPFGIVLVTGPTGSGKTTTLYSAVMHRKDEGINIATIEDPVEYTIEGLVQMQTNPSVGLTFAAAIRAMMRQDPDIIMVGETRDAETARTALTAALTGHLVFTSLHANGSLAALVRLRNMGIEPYLLSTATAGIIYQRLLRRICPDCAEPHEYPDELTARIRPGGLAEGDVLYHGKGCHLCNDTGFRGRVAAFEALTITEELRNLISLDASMSDLRDAAIRGGFRPIQEYCYHLLTRGLTTPHDALTILYSA